MAASPGHPGQYCDPEPPFLAIGTEVSAKYKGAFCEAKIKKIVQHVKCRVTFGKSGAGVVVNHDCIKGPLRVGATVEAKHPDNKNGEYREAVISKIMDVSLYTVVFDDGDETTLRRTSLCLKSGRHYAESESLDHLPLTNPEHWGNPVSILGRSRRSRRRAGQLMNSPGSYGALNLSDAEDNESAEGDALGSIDDEDDSGQDGSNLTQPSSSEQKDKDEDIVENSNGSTATVATSVAAKDRQDNRSPDWGTVVCVEVTSDKRNSKSKDTWYPALVVCPAAQDKPVDVKDEYLVRSFKDGRYYVVAKKDVKEFVKSIYCSALPDASTSGVLKSALDKVTAYLDRRELPTSWDADALLGSNQNAIVDGPPSVEAEADTIGDAGMASSELDSAADEDFEEADDEPNNEERDRFVAQLYKFMDDRATPINRAPAVGGKDLDLYRLYILVNKMGGYKKITDKNNWKIVYTKMNLPNTGANSESAENALKGAYKKYLTNFNDFYRKLGGFSAFVHNTQPSRNSSSRPSRNERNWRERHDSGKEVIPAKSSRRKKSATETEPLKKEVVEESPLLPSSTVPEVTDKDDKSVADDEEKNSSRRNSTKKRNAKSSAKKKVAAIIKPDPCDSDQGGPGVDGPDGGGGDGGSDSEGEGNKDPPIGKDVEVAVGDKIKVRYGKSKELYDAKILKADKNADPTKQRFWVHYAGWNTRYDEWIKRNRIIQVITDKTPKDKRRSGNNKQPPPSKTIKNDIPPGDGNVKAEPKVLESPMQPTPSKRGRPPSAASGTKATIAGDVTSVNTKQLTPKAQPSSKPFPGTQSKRTRRRSETIEDAVDEAIPSANVADDDGNESCDESDQRTGRFSREDSVSSLSNQATEAKRIKSEPLELEKTSEPVQALDIASKEEKPVESKASSPAQLPQDKIQQILELKKELDAGSILSRRLSQDPIERDKAPVAETLVQQIKEKSPEGGLGQSSSADDCRSSETSSKNEDDEPQQQKLSKRKRVSKDQPEQSSKKDLDDKRKAKSVSKETSEEDISPKKKKSRKSKHDSKDVKESGDKDSKSKLKSSRKNKQQESREDESDKVSQQQVQPLPNEDELKGKRKRTAPHSKGKDTPLTALAHSPLDGSKVKEELPPKKRKRDDERQKDEGHSELKEDTTRLFENMNIGEQAATVNLSSATVPECSSPKAFPLPTDIVEPEGAGSFLLCAEEVPMSPVHQVEEKCEEQISQQPTNSTFASAVAPAALASYPSSAIPPSATSSGNNSGNASSNSVKDAASEVGHFTPPTTPDSLRSGTLSSLTPPHETNDVETQSTMKSAANSTSNSDCEGDSKPGSSNNKQPYGSPPQEASEDSCSQQGLGDSTSNNGGPSNSKRDTVQQSPATSPKKRMRGPRKRLGSTSEPSKETSKNERTPIKTRGSTGRRARAKLDMDNDQYLPSMGVHALDLLVNHQSIPTICLETYKPNTLLVAVHPTSKYNFCQPIDESLDADKRIQILQDRLSDLRSTYMNIKAEMASLERRRKKAKRKDRSAANSPNGSRPLLDRTTSGDFSTASDESKTSKANEQATPPVTAT